MNVWDIRARLYDLCEGSDLRRGPHKAALFQNMHGKVLFVALGTGLDIKHFPPGHDIVAIDISERMLRKAEQRCKQYRGSLAILQADALHLCFADASFDTVVTSCTLCSVPDPIRVLGEFRRVLRPGGALLMFEHVRSRHPILGLVLDLMTLWTRPWGTEMNRHTVRNVLAAGFRITRIDSVYLDIILSIHARKDECAEKPCSALAHTIPLATKRRRNESNAGVLEMVEAHGEFPTRYGTVNGSPKTQHNAATESGS